MKYFCTIQYPIGTTEAFKEAFRCLILVPHVKVIVQSQDKDASKYNGARIRVQWFESSDEGVYETVSPYDYGYVSRMVHEQMISIKQNLTNHFGADALPDVGYTIQMVVGSGNLSAIACNPKPSTIPE